MAFSESLRGNRLSMGQGPMYRALGMLEQQALTGGRGRGIRPMRAGANQQNPNSWVTEQARGRGLPPGVTNVVYDTGPEEFAKKHALAGKKLEADIARENTEAALRERGTSVAEQRAAAYEQSIINRDKASAEAEAGRERRAELAAKSAQERVETQQRGATGRTGMTVAGADLRSQRNADLQARLQNARSDAEMAQIMQEFQNEYAIKDTFRPKVSLNEKVQEMMGKALAENPDYWKVIEQDEKGNYRIIPPAAGTSGLSAGADPVGALRSQLTRRIYGPQEVPLNQGADRGIMDPRQPVAPGGQTGYGPQPQRRQPQNQADLARLAAGVKQDFQAKKGRAPSPEELEAILAYYLGR